MSKWENGKKYNSGDVVLYDELYFKCVQAHTSQSDWYPCIDTLSLWAPFDGIPPTSEEPKPKPQEPKHQEPAQQEPAQQTHVEDMQKPAQQTHVEDPLSKREQKDVSGRLKTLLKGAVPLGAYFQSWSSAWASDASKMDLALIKKPCNIVYLSFVKPNAKYKKGANSFSGTGLDFNSDFSVVKSAIQILKSRGVVVMLAMGGESYSFDTVNYEDVANLCNDLGCNGIDIDWEDKAGKGASSKLGPIINNVRNSSPNKCVSLTCFSVGAYGEGKFKNEKPDSNNTGMCIQGIKSNGNDVDWINIMSYDAGNSYSPTIGFDAYSSYYDGPIMIGAEVPPEAWGGHVLSLNELKEHAKHIKDKGYNGVFVWSYQKQGSPSCDEILNAAYYILKLTGSPPSLPSPSSIEIPSSPSSPSIPQITPPMPTIVTENTTVLAPYLYTWGYDNDIYKINKCMDIVEKVRGNAATIAFVIGKSADDIINTFGDDFKKFKDNAGQIIISFGGASGEYMESLLSVEEMVAEITKLINKTDCKALDFDIEGGTLSNQLLNAKRAEVITSLQKNFPGLYVSFTLPADQTGLTDDGKQLILSSINSGVKISIINIMAMDIGAIPAGMSWGTIANKMGEATVTQIQEFYPNKTRSEIYRMLGITVMIGKNDDGSEFTLADAAVVGGYAKENNIGLLSFWAINRDQIGTGNLGIYSQVNTRDYEFYIAMKRALGSLGTLPNANYVAPPAPKDTWVSGTTYKVGDKVFIGGKKYSYATSHISTDSLKPNETPSLWTLI